VSSGDGFARFDNLPAPAIYRVVESVPPDLIPTTDAEYDNVAIAPNSVLDLPFGLYDERSKVYLPILWQTASD